MKKIFTLLLVFNFISFPILAEENSKVLAILPLSGDLAQIGTAVKNGMLMAKDKHSIINLEFEDDAGVPKNTVSALRKHLAIEKPLVVVCASSGTCKSISPILEQVQIPLIAVATDEEISKGKKYVVNFWVTPDEEAKIMVKEAMSRGYKNIAIFSTIHEGPLSIKRKFLAENKNQLNVVFDEEFSPDLKDFRSIITKFKALTKTKEKEVDAIFLNVFFGQNGIFAKQLRELGVLKDLFCIELFEDENEVRSSKGALYDQWYVQADDATGEFLKEYSTRYPTQSSFGAANGHDSIMLIGKAINEGNQSPDEINNFLHSVKDYSGASGVYSSTSDNRYTLPATIKLVTKAGFKRIGVR